MPPKGAQEPGGSLQTRSQPGGRGETALRVLDPSGNGWDGVGAIPIPVRASPG